MESITMQTCPVCNGAGTVQRPPWIAGDQPTWATDSTQTYECKACKGTGIIMVNNIPLTPVEEIEQ